MESIFARIRAQTAWLLLYGPVLSFLPEKWRGRRLNQKFALWNTATVISGAGEIFVGVNIFGIWLAFQFSPVLLWVGMYFLCDGVWRAFNASIQGESAGSVLLMFVDQRIDAARKSVWRMAHPIVSDFTTLDDVRQDWQLKIEAVRQKRKWEAGKIVRFGERYFCVESCVQFAGPRPFVYLLRSLEAGVPSHSVLTYTPVEISQKPS